ncbi:hypothetical protein AAL_05792 [Moelleriella libera RCEF 2490]|uniref:Uncharacterized protein n=1 Tax=Moelleriella libera RCEF 2490 TaxID=1081109 RepID=A0A168A361_9HYPO|nr:hypothetical protein AAL_05792 [Moelleriella libera RCEF 2490]
MSRPELKATAHGDTSAYLLKRTTTELAEDLSKIKDADDFKADKTPDIVPKATWRISMRLFRAFQDMVGRPSRFGTSGAA